MSVSVCEYVHGEVVPMRQLLWVLATRLNLSVSPLGMELRTLCMLATSSITELCFQSLIYSF